MRLFLVEDDELLAQHLKTALIALGYAVDHVMDGLIADQILKTEKFDVIILDLNLPGLSGLKILKKFRANGHKTPVLILTANESLEDCITGLDQGGDDYLTKPFDLDELLARIRVLQRRLPARAEPMLTHGDIVLDPASHTVTLNNQLVPVSRREFSLLFKLLENQGRVLSREVLTQALYGWGDDIHSNVLEVHIHQLRKRLGSKFIRTLRGIGYIIDPIQSAPKNPS